MYMFLDYQEVVSFDDKANISTSILLNDKVIPI